MDFVRGLRELSKEELAEFGEEYASASSSVHMPNQPRNIAIFASCNHSTISMVRSEMETKVDNQIVGEYDVVVNCSGLGARKLVGDEKLIPSRGQVVRVRAPAVHHFFMDDDDYILINRDFVILGSTHDQDQDSRSHCQRGNFEEDHREEHQDIPRTAERDSGLSQGRPSSLQRRDQTGERREENDEWKTDVDNPQLRSRWIRNHTLSGIC
ncbi:hypothetical protein PMAYCL1PPCAC_06364 [Pristionchus mayeri]|uniref:FAD dependent oxidoreductase domain-containing protein n=1 Tax=Pristionchus mayeri TaxID=1317129 RepID=A0AAN5CBL4_9BILA|nr:hypothetical protein PMAYCL1PPCAC_06364 [Pristionchus mayeri]